jgi:hypothetical protein
MPAFHEVLRFFGVRLLLRAKNDVVAGRLAFPASFMAFSCHQVGLQGLSVVIRGLYANT